MHYLTRSLSVCCWVGECGWHRGADGKWQTIRRYVRQNNDTAQYECHCVTSVKTYIIWWFAMKYGRKNRVMKQEFKSGKQKHEGCSGLQFIA